MTINNDGQMIVRLALGHKVWVCVWVCKLRNRHTRAQDYDRLLFQNMTLWPLAFSSCPPFQSFSRRRRVSLAAAATGVA